MIGNKKKYWQAYFKWFDKLNRKTFIKIISSDHRYTKTAAKQFKPKHSIRTKPKAIGNIQTDLKVLGRHETKVNKYVYLFNMIDISFRFVFSKTLIEPKTHYVLEALEEGYAFFKKIISI